MANLSTSSRGRGCSFNEELSRSLRPSRSPAMAWSSGNSIGRCDIPWMVPEGRGRLRRLPASDTRTLPAEGFRGRAPRLPGCLPDDVTQPASAVLFRSSAATPFGSSPP